MFSSRTHRPDYFLMALVLVLIIFGFVMLVSVSSEFGKIKFDDNYYYLKHQFFYGFLPGLVGFLAALSFRYTHYRSAAFFMLLGTMVLLVLVFTPFGVAANNATRWIQIGPVRFQPAELLKLTFIIYIAAWLSHPNMKRAVSFWKGLLPFLIISGIVGALLVLQPATSTVAILLGAGLVVYFLCGASLKYILGTI